MHQQLWDRGAYRSAQAWTDCPRLYTHTRMQSSYISGLRGCVQYIPGLNPLCPPHKLLFIPHQHVPTSLILLNNVLICSVLLVLTLIVVGKNKTRPVQHQVCLTVDSRRPLVGSRGYSLLGSMSSLLPNSQIHSPYSLLRVTRSKPLVVMERRVIRLSWSWGLCGHSVVQARTPSGWPVERFVVDLQANPWALEPLLISNEGVFATMVTYSDQTAATPVPIGLLWIC